MDAIASPEPSPKRSKDFAKIVGSFPFLSQDASAEIGATAAAVAKTDDPPFLLELATAGLTAALGGGLAAAAEHLASKFTQDEVLKEFVKATYEHGMESGLEIGKAKLSATGDVRGDFFLAQKEGFTTIAQAQQDNFIDAADTMTTRGWPGWRTPRPPPRSSWPRANSARFLGTRGLRISLNTKTVLSTAGRACKNDRDGLRERC
ncbi:MAG TPA: hypothetical protein VHV78_11495 [Gemmatimonadaceae bacterium]|jgi:hypothetical protein|nr:hypothetical protein [Gemmatimonadaceae bacterium]